MTTPAHPVPSPAGSSFSRSAKVIIVGSVMFTFISYWRAAAVVLCDLASTAYYIGGIVEAAIGPAAPWYILAVMVFSYFVRMIYIESCSLFVRGGVYRVVRTAMGETSAKLAVSALMFDYLLTGPISSVSAGQYLIGLMLDLPGLINKDWVIDDGTKKMLKTTGSVLVALAITGYFFRLNILGIHESSERALQIMKLTTVMGVVVAVWCFVTIAMQGTKNPVPPLTPDLRPKVEMVKTDEGNLVPKIDPETNQPEPKKNEVTGWQENPLGFIRVFPSLAGMLAQYSGTLSLIGLLGLGIAFGHSVLAMSGEETLAQVYREIESPKLPNLQRAAFIVFVYSILLTGGISFLAVLLIPESVRMPVYNDNLISGLAMSMYGPAWACYLLNVFVVFVGFLILAGAVNTAIIGSNGVLNRVAEDGIMPDWFCKPHPKYGTTYRMLTLIVALQVLIIIITWGNVLLLGEAYAFGVLWSFVFQALAMTMLRFKDTRPREYKVPLNVMVGGREIPVGLLLVLFVLLTTAMINFLTKEVATMSGIVFTGFFFALFNVSEVMHKKKRKGSDHEHLEQFNEDFAEAITAERLGLKLPYRKLVSIRSPQNLYMLEKTLAETDPLTTDVVVMTAKVTPEVSGVGRDSAELDRYDLQLMTAVVERAEKAGKPVKPLIMATNNPLHTIIRTARDLNAQELVLGASNKYNADEQLDQISFYWINVHDGLTPPLTVRLLGRDRDVHLDLGGGNRIPKISERQARTVSELRAAGVGADRVLLAHDGSRDSSDLFQAVLTLLDPEVVLTLVPVPHPDAAHAGNGADLVAADLEQARHLGRELNVEPLRSSELEAELIRLVREGKYDLVVLGVKADFKAHFSEALDVQSFLRQAPCRVFLAAPASIPLEPETDARPAAGSH